MRNLLTTTALALALIVPGLTGAHAQGTSTGGNDKSGTTGTMTTTPHDAIGDARVNTPPVAPATDTAGGMGATTGTMGGTADNPLHAMKGEQIIGKTVYGSNGEEIGEIDNVVLAQGGKSPEALIGVGGFLGIGERDVTIPLDQIRMEGDRLMTNMTKESIGGLQPYEKDRYQEYDRSRTLGGM